MWLAGNRVKIKTSGGATQELEYDARGNIVGVADGNRNRTTYRLDHWGRIIGIVKADGSTEFYSYDCAGNMVSSTDGEGHTTRYEYGRAGKLTAIQDPAGERETYGYDAEGRLVRKTDRNGVTVELGYNLYGAPLFKKVKDGAPGDFYEYTPEGLLKCAVSAGMRYAYEYDALGRMTRKSASGRTLLALAYDGNGNKVRQTDAAGKITKFVYSPLDLLAEVWDDGHKLAAYEYNVDGTVRAESHGPVQRQFQYDLDKNLTGLLVQSGGELLAENQYLYDGNGNRTLKRQLGGDTLYHYDPLNQLQKVEYPSYTEELFYDKAGNRTRRIARGVEELYQYDPRNRLTAGNVELLALQLIEAVDAETGGRFASDKVLFFGLLAHLQGAIYQQKENPGSRSRRNAQLPESCRELYASVKKQAPLYRLLGGVSPDQQELISLTLHFALAQDRTTTKWRALLVSSAGVIIQQSQRKFLQDCLPQIEIVDICSPYQFSVYPDSSYDFIISMTPLAGAAKPVADVSHMTKAQRVQFIEEFLFEKLDSRGGA